MVSVVSWSRPRRTEVRDGRRETGGRRPGSRGRGGADGGGCPAAGRDVGRVGRTPAPCRGPCLHAAQGDPPGGRPHDRSPSPARGPCRRRRAPARPLARLFHDDARGPGAVHAGGPGRGEEPARAARPAVEAPARGNPTGGARPGGGRRLHATRDGVLRGGLDVPTRMPLANSEAFNTVRDHRARRPCWSSSSRLLAEDGLHRSFVRDFIILPDMRGGPASSTSRDRGDRMSCRGSFEQ